MHNTNHVSIQLYFSRGPTAGGASLAHGNGGQ